MDAVTMLLLLIFNHTTIQSHHCTTQIIWHEGSAIDLLLNSAMFVLIPGGCDLPGDI